MSDTKPNHHWLFYIFVGGAVLAVLLVFVNLVLVVRLRQLQSAFYASCEASNTTIVSSNLHLRAGVRQVLRDDGRAGMAALVADVPTKDCTTGKPIRRGSNGG